MTSDDTQDWRVAHQFRSGHDIIVESQHWLSTRLVELQLLTPLIDNPVGVRILVPHSYDPASTHRHPLYVFLHGGLGGFRDWTDHGNLEALTDGHDFVAVMPSGGTGGWYRDWQNFGRHGNPRWETFHINCLVPWLESQFTIRTDKAGRAIAGVSMGGYGALSYAARHPDMFGAAASFSGAVDLSVPLVSLLVGVSPVAHGRPPLAIHGWPFRAHASWHAHNPVHLVHQLRDVNITFTCGNGRPTRWKAGRDARPKDLQEHQVRIMNLRLHQRMLECNIDHCFVDYGNVGHVWANWSNATRDWLAAQPLG